MPRRCVPSKSQRASFEALPVELTGLAPHYTLSDEDLVMIRNRRWASNKLGFALQLCLLRYPGRTLRAGEKPHYELIRFVAEQIGDEASDFAEYALRDQTRREHVSFLIAKLRLSTFTQAHFRGLIRWLLSITVENPKSVFLVGAVLN